MTADLRTAAATLSDLALHAGHGDLTGAALAVRAALAATPAPAAQPVAWQLPGSDSIITAQAKAYRGVRAEPWTAPLYASPTAPAEPARPRYVDCGECPAISTGCPAGKCMKAPKAEPVQAPSVPPLTDEYVGAVVRTAQPDLDLSSWAWTKELSECQYWLKAERDMLAARPTQPDTPTERTP